MNQIHGMGQAYHDLSFGNFHRYPPGVGYDIVNDHGFGWLSWLAKDRRRHRHLPYLGALRLDLYVLTIRSYQTVDIRFHHLRHHHLAHLC
jgi:hypothetical protein